jgi:hypothetical protein
MLGFLILTVAYEGMQQIGERWEMYSPGLKDSPDTKIYPKEARRQVLTEFMWLRIGISVGSI